MADFSLLQQPDFARAALGGYQAGASLGRQRQLDAALGSIDLDRPETLLPVLRADPSTGAALIGASVKLSSARRDAEAKQATANYIKAITGGGAAASAGGAPAASSAAPDASQAAPVAGTAPADPNEIVVTGQRAPTVDPLVAARNAAIDADPDAFMKMQSQIGTMQEGDRKRLADATDAFGSVAQQALSMPYQQRKAFLASQGGYLSQHGVTPDHIAGFDPTDDALHTEIGKATGVKFQLEQADKDRAFGLQQDRFKHDVAHDSVTEAQGAQRIGLEGANVGIARGHLALDQAKEKRTAGTASGGTSGGIATPTSKAEYNALPAGSRYFKNGQVFVKGGGNG